MAEDRTHRRGTVRSHVDEDPLREREAPLAVRDGRRAVAEGRAGLDELMSRDLSELRLAALMLDGVHFAEACCVVALATLLGFVLAIAAIVLSFGDSERFRLLRESAQYRTLWRTFVSSIRVLCLATVVSLAALFGDRERPHDNRIIMVVFAFATTWALLRLLRTIWALEGIIGIATTPAVRQSSSSSP